MDVANKLSASAICSGASGAALIKRSSIVFDERYRDICQSNGCGRYGKCYMCPPDLGNFETLMESVLGYSEALMYQSIHSIEDSFDFEGMMDAGKKHAAISQALHAEAKSVLGNDFLHLSVSCRLCENCAKIENQPCRHPHEALGPLEGYGIDVYKTSQNAGLSYVNGVNTVTYFGMILFRG